MDWHFQIFGAKTTPDIRSGFLGIVTGPETILPDMSVGPTDFREAGGQNSVLLPLYSVIVKVMYDQTKLLVVNGIDNAFDRMELDLLLQAKAVFYWKLASTMYFQEINFNWKTPREQSFATHFFFRCQMRFSGGKLLLISNSALIRALYS